MSPERMPARAAGEPDSTAETKTPERSSVTIAWPLMPIQSTGSPATRSAMTACASSAEMAKNWAVSRRPA